MGLGVDPLWDVCARAAMAWLLGALFWGAGSLIPTEADVD